MGAFSWLFGGNDHELARTQYADRESASDRAARKDAEREAKKAKANRAAHHRSAVQADRKGQAWGDRQRRRYS